MILFRASLETRNFSFEAYGRTEAVATSMLIDALHIHAQQYAIEHDWWAQDRDSFVVRMVASGLMFRDGEQLNPA